ncbi:MAG: hypothetical protein ABI594_20400, partial [Ginsengibacter sp.]
VTATKPGYFTGYRTFTATSGVNQVAIKLIKKTLAGSVDGASGGDIAFSNGSKVSLPANGFIKKSDGSSYNGKVNVYAHYIDPAASDINESVPGSFMANDKDNKRVVLKSFGMLAVELESASGEKLQIAKNNTAKLTIAIPASLQSSAPSSISLWYIDEHTGLWKEEGTATKSGTTYVGEVKHFSYWNADFSGPAIVLSMILKSQSGAPLVYANVSINTDNNGSDSIGMGHGWTDSLGQLTAMVPANKNLTLNVVGPCGMPIYSQGIGPFSQNTDLGTITVTNAGVYITTIHGKIIDCNNANVSNGYAIIYYDNILRYAATDNNGNFTTTFVNCQQASSDFQITCVDNLSQQQGQTITLSITSSDMDAGSISACGNSSSEFINYNIDGTDYNLSMSAGDSALVYSYPGPTPLSTTYVRGDGQGNFINFDFSHNNSKGIFPLNNCSSNPFVNMKLIKPFTLTVTNYPQNIGDFYEGNFLGKFTDSLITTPVHKITCSFRLRKNY